MKIGRTPNSMDRMSPIQRDAMQKNARGNGKGGNRATFNGLSDKGGDNPVWGD